MNASSKEKDKEYFLEGIKMLLMDKETVDNFMDVLSDYRNALESKNNLIIRLHQEIKIVKKLKV